MNNPIIMTEEYWANSQFSVARYTGGINAFGHKYIIVNKDGKDIFQCSIEAEKAGREKAIEPGEPCDLVRTDFILLYKKLGRDTFIRLLETNAEKGDEAIWKIMNEYNKQ